MALLLWVLQPPPPTLHSCSQSTPAAVQPYWDAATAPYTTAVRG
jgi:hypothetical protein